MNAEPHTHTPTVRTTYGFTPRGRFVLTYGDTAVYFWFRSSVERALSKAVKKHDTGSVKAGQPGELTAKAQSRVREAKTVWGADVLAGVAEIPEDAPAPAPKENWRTAHYRVVKEMNDDVMVDAWKRGEPQAGREKVRENNRIFL